MRPQRSVPCHPRQQQQFAGGEWREATPLDCTRSHMSVAVVREKLFVIGGTTLKPQGGHRALRSVACYDAINGEWSDFAPLCHARYRAAVVVFNETCLMICGGYGDTEIECISKHQGGEWIDTAQMDAIQWRKIPGRMSVARARYPCAVCAAYLPAAHGERVFPSRQVCCCRGEWECVGDWRRWGRPGCGDIRKTQGDPSRSPPCIHPSLTLLDPLCLVGLRLDRHPGHSSDGVEPCWRA
jgi:hypothetical protein